MKGEPFFDCQVGIVGSQVICLKGIMGIKDFEENTNRADSVSVGIVNPYCLHFYHFQCLPLCIFFCVFSDLTICCTIQLHVTIVNVTLHLILWRLPELISHNL